MELSYGNKKKRTVSPFLFDAPISINKLTIMG